MSTFSQRIRPYVDRELSQARQRETEGDSEAAFVHLERAHILGQASTREHVRTHVRMLLWAVRQRKSREVAGQALRIIGAATKTAFGFIPAGNTGGASISAFKRLPIPDDLAQLITAAKLRG